MTDKMGKLVAGCKCGVYVLINAHRDNYGSAAEYLEEMNRINPGMLGLEQPIRGVMEETNTIVDVLFYRDSPDDFYRVLHYDLDTALDTALSALEDDARAHDE